MSKFGLKKFVGEFKSDESGATAIEYALIASGIALVIITGVAFVGGSLTSTFNTVAGMFQD